QAEDGIRDDLVTGVQTCALPISRTMPVGSMRVGTAPSATPSAEEARKLVVLVGGCVNSITTPNNGDSIGPITVDDGGGGGDSFKIGRASCRGRGWVSVVAVWRNE